MTTSFGTLGAASASKKPLIRKLEHGHRCCVQYIAVDADSLASRSVHGKCWKSKGKVRSDALLMSSTTAIFISELYLPHDEVIVWSSGGSLPDRGSVAGQ